MLAAQSVPPLVQALVPLGLGVAATLMGLGLVPASLDAKKAAQWRKRWGSTYTVGGPLLIVVGLVMLARALWS